METQKNTSQTVPAGWKWVRLGDLCEFIRGVSFDKADQRATPSEGCIPILRAGNIEGELNITDDLIWVPRRYVSTEQLLQVNDIAICLSSGSPAVVGKSAQLRDKFVGSVGAFCGIVRPTHTTDPVFLAQWLRSSHFFEWRDSQARGANIQNLRFAEFASLSVLLPPLSEQKRISAILNEHMAAMESARAACEAQLEAAQALPAAYLRSVFESPEAKKWERETIGNLAPLVIDGPHITPTYVSKGVPFLTVRNIVNRRIDLSDVSYVSPSDHEQFSRRGKAERGDILYTKDGTLGIPCVVNTDKEFSYFVSVALIKLLRHRVDPQFVAYALESPAVLEQVKLLGAGAGLKHMVLKSIKALVVPVPPLKQQRRIAEIITDKMQTAAQLISISRSQLDAINKLPAAFLRKAFNGEL